MSVCSLSSILDGVSEFELWLLRLHGVDIVILEHEISVGALDG